MAFRTSRKPSMKLGPEGGPLVDVAANFEKISYAPEGGQPDTKAMLDGSKFKRAIGGEPMTQKLNATGAITQTTTR